MSEGVYFLVFLEGDLKTSLKEFVSLLPYKLMDVSYNIAPELRKKHPKKYPPLGASIPALASKKSGWSIKKIKQAIDNVPDYYEDIGVWTKICGISEDISAHKYFGAYLPGEQSIEMRFSDFEVEQAGKSYALNEPNSIMPELIALAEKIVSNMSIKALWVDCPNYGVGSFEYFKDPYYLFSHLNDDELSEQVSFNQPKWLELNNELRKKITVEEITEILENSGAKVIKGKYGGIGMAVNKLPSPALPKFLLRREARRRGVYIKNKDADYEVLFDAGHIKSKELANKGLISKESMKRIKSRKFKEAEDALTKKDKLDFGVYNNGSESND